MKVLNLYACLGGNRYKWDNCEVTAVELDPHLASMYKERFPQDTVLVEDAHEYLKNHYQEYDFIWTSPPCPTHSKIRYTQKNTAGFKPVFPNMLLYEEIIFLQHHFIGKYVVENVKPYYEPLIEPQIRNRHYYWCNFTLPENIGRKEAKGKSSGAGSAKVNRQLIAHGKTYKTEQQNLCELHKISQDFLNQYKGKQNKRKIIRNLVDYQAGLDIFNAARGTFEANEDQTNFLEVMEVSK